MGEYKHYFAHLLSEGYEANERFSVLNPVKLVN